VARATQKEFEKLRDRIQKDEKRLPVEEGLGLAGLKHLVLPQDYTPAELDDACACQGGCYEYWCAVRRDAQARLAEVKEEFDLWYLIKADKAKLEIDAPKSKPPTQTDIKAHVLRDEAVLEEHNKKRAQIRELTRQADLLGDITKAWEQKHILLGPMTKAMEREVRNSNEVSLRGNRGERLKRERDKDPEPEQNNTKKKPEKRKKRKKKPPVDEAW